MKFLLIFIVLVFINVPHVGDGLHSHLETFGSISDDSVETFDGEVCVKDLAFTIYSLKFLDNFSLGVSIEEYSSEFIKVMLGHVEHQINAIIPIFGALVVHYE